MPPTRHLTKSRFKLALECPNKLFYTRKRATYSDGSIDDPFMIALAEGGFQVGELAKFYKPGGIDIKTLDEEEALSLTNQEMQKENAIVYEGAFLYKGCFIRADVVVKKGKNIHLYEVKAKSYRGKDSFEMLNAKTGLPKPKWEPYVYDLAFQKHIIQNLFPVCTVYGYLTLADKDVACSVEGLNQHFFLEEIEGRKSVRVVGDVSLDALGTQLLTDVNLDAALSLIYQTDHTIAGVRKYNGREFTFEELVDEYATHYKDDIEFESAVSSACLGCQFRDEQNYNKSGFHRCWKRELKFSDDDFKKPPSFDLWGGSIGSRTLKKELIEKGKYFMTAVDEADFIPKNVKEVSMGMSAHVRRLHQVELTNSNASESIIYKKDLKIEMDSWTYPLHFIDFETSALAIPMHKGLHPYEGVAFQFSHHMVQADGTVAHTGEWINMVRGFFPNFEFVRQLKQQLSDDEGTIFRYHNHENTYLNMIYSQLKNSAEKDKESLMQFIQSITHPTKSNADQWESGDRDMVDLHQLVVKYYLHPLMKGSNSIKKVLPAVLNESAFLQEKYSKPIYGNEIASKNFKNQVWVTKGEDGKIRDPYSLLQPVFTNLSEGQLLALVTGDRSDMKDGGAAMMAYARIQFSEMTDFERDQYIQALLRYCELDTLAMVMIYEHWKSLLG